MIIRVKIIEETPEDDWFESCSYALEITAGCKQVKLREYLRLHHITTLLALPDKTVFSMIANSKRIHGFVYGTKLFIHPTGFATYYLKMLVKHIDNPIDDYVH